MKLLSESRRRRKFMILVEQSVSQSVGGFYSLLCLLLISRLDEVKAEARQGQRLDEWQSKRFTPNDRGMRDWELLLCWRDGKQEGRRGWMRRWKTALVQSAGGSSQKCSEASRTASLYVMFLLLSLTPPEKRVCPRCGWVCICKKKRCVVAPFSEVLELFSPPLRLPSSWAAASWMHPGDAASLFISLFHSLTLPLPFFPLAHSHSACSLAAFSPSSFSSSSPVIILLHHSQRSSVVLQRWSSVCRVQPLEGFPARVHKVKFTVGNTVRRALQATPTSLAIHPCFDLLFCVSRINLSSYRWVNKVEAFSVRLVSGWTCIFCCFVQLKKRITNLSDCMIFVRGWLLNTNYFKFKPPGEKHLPSSFRFIYLLNQRCKNGWSHVLYRHWSP